MRAFIVILSLIGLASPASAFDLCFSGERLLFQTSVWSKHHEPKPDHNNGQELINLECQAPDTWRFAWQREGGAVDRMPWLRDVNWLAGGASFLNSFYQRSTYIYGGGRYDMMKSGDAMLYTKVTAGLVHGYRGEHKDAIPFNQLGIAPVILPAIGVQYQRVGFELVFYGTAGLMLNVGVYSF